MDRDIFFVGMAAASAIDLRTRRIPNWMTYSLVCIGLVAAAGRSWGVDSPSLLFESSRLTFGPAALGMMVCFGVLLVGWLGFGMGGGDVKLAAATGVSLGMSTGLLAISLAYIMAGFLVLGVVLAKTQRGRVATQALVSIGAGEVTERFAQRFSAGLKSEVPMAPFFFLGSAYALILENLS